MAPSDIQSHRRRSPLRPAIQRDTRRTGDVADAINRVRQLVRGLRLAEQRTRTATGLSAAQLFLLRRLADVGAASLTDLAEATLTDRSSVAALVDRLETAGLVTSGRDVADRRRVLVRLTARGARTVADAPAAPTTILMAALERMSAAEVRAVCSSLGRLNDAMGLTEPPEMLFEDRPLAPGGRR